MSTTRFMIATAVAVQPADSKIVVEDHLKRLGITDGSGHAQRRAVVISNRNLGTNHGHLAWQQGQSPRIFRVLEDPADYPAYSCLVLWPLG